jgi:hypothetical protein
MALMETMNDKLERIIGEAVAASSEVLLLESVATNQKTNATSVSSTPAEFRNQHLPNKTHT